MTIATPSKPVPSLAFVTSQRSAATPEPHAWMDSYSILPNGTPEILTPNPQVKSVRALHLGNALCIQPCIVWPAQIHHLGLCEDEQDAARMYDRAAVLLRGRTATLNFPELSAPRAPQQIPPGGHSSLAGGTLDPRAKEPGLPRVPAAIMAQGSLLTSDRPMCAH